MASRSLTGARALVAVLAALTAVTAQITEPGICPFSIPLADWSEEQFVAEPWYEVRAFAVPGLHSLRPHCTRWHFSAAENGQGLHARLAYRTGDGDAALRAFAQYTTSEKHPRFNLTFHDLGGAGESRSVHMKLVATDYDDFALLWGCTEPNLLERKVVSWVLSRRPYLSENAQEALRSLFRLHDIQADKFVDTDHDDQTCGAPGALADADLPEDALDSRTDSVFAAYRKESQDSDVAVDDADDASVLSSAPLQLGADSEGEAVSVSASYVGSGWLQEALGAQGVLVAALLALAFVSLIASLLTFRALVGRMRLQRGGGGGKPVLPVHRQDVVVATLGAGVDYSRFGGLGHGVQTRKQKHALDVDAVPRA
ncbi:hypothetical protein ONE63_008561 [Megalurothrips usitatus]|uniref:Lipocalin/cytosolic fatty-acid binding domain-containing protein n=1 Tax=Megalurothrips usitatus TaxID=439358 RepID=A0AAV7XTG0_9NEOP|nr:hypothetical protein ONE63_008561 [Megalurothrips usitatus]